MLLSLLITVFRIIVLPVGFEDRPFVQTQQEVRTETERIRQYFARQFGDAQDFRVDPAPAVLLPRPVSWYGANRPDRKDLRLGDAVREACRLAAERQVDFSGCDLVCLLYPGPGEDESGAGNDIWPQYGLLSAGGSPVGIGGTRIDRYIACPAGRPGIFAHELGHALGLPDLYDTDGTASGGRTRGLWGISLMDEGCKAERIPDFTAVEYDRLGLGSCDTLRAGTTYSLAPLQSGRRYAKILTEREGEYFLLEARDGGLLVFHVDRSDAPAGYSERLGAELTARERWENDAVNDNPDHPCARIIPAYPAAAAIGEALFPRPGLTSFGSDTPAQMRSWSGRAPGLALTGIRTDAGGTVSFEVIEPLALTELTVYQDAAVLRWRVAEGLETLGYELRWSDGTEDFSRDLAADALSCTLEGLRPQTGYNFSLLLRGVGSDRFSVGDKFVTKVLHSGSYPYIYLNGAVRNADGSFPAGSRLPLRVFNAADAQRIRWTFDGTLLVPEADGSCVLSRSGLLRAELFYDDGTSESIFKQIVVR